MAQPISLLTLPTELKYQILSYLIPDQRYIDVTGQTLMKEITSFPGYDLLLIHPHLTSIWAEIFYDNLNIGFAFAYDVKPCIESLSEIERVSIKHITICAWHLEEVFVCSAIKFCCSCLPNLQKLSIDSAHRIESNSQLELRSWLARDLRRIEAAIQLPGRFFDARVSLAEWPPWYWRRKIWTITPTNCKLKGSRKRGAKTSLTQDQNPFDMQQARQNHAEEECRARRDIQTYQASLREKTEGQYTEFIIRKAESHSLKARYHRSVYSQTKWSLLEHKWNRSTSAKSSISYPSALPTSNKAENRSRCAAHVYMMAKDRCKSVIAHLEGHRRELLRWKIECQRNNPSDRWLECKKSNRRDSDPARWL